MSKLYTIEIKQIFYYPVLTIEANSLREAKEKANTKMDKGEVKESWMNIIITGERRIV